MDEQVDILVPPLFEKNGTVKTREQAYDDGDWIGTFNLWIVQRTPRPSLVYQVRSPQKTWAPNKLDVAGAGHYQTGESLADGLREVQEELGKNYRADQITGLGRKIYVGFDTKNREMHNVIDVNIIEDNDLLTSYKLQAEEVYAICSCPLDELIKVHDDPSYHFEVTIHTADQRQLAYTVSRDSFPENFDKYHLKMVLLAQRFLNNEKHLLY